MLDGEDRSETIDYRALSRRARRVAMGLRAWPAGERALLIFPPGLDFIAGFLGCLHAGLIAVPAYPPTFGRLARSLPRLEAIAANAGANVILTTSPILDRRGAITAHAPSLGRLNWVATDRLPEGIEEEWSEPDIGPDDVAFLQYTSGSTGAPKGVMVTHGNLLANLECTCEACFRGAKDSIYVGWLPPYHDMGLIGQLLQPLYSGYPCITMSPLHFLQRPFRWLRAITRYRGTTSASPNFAFDVCNRKIPPEERAQLDLSSLSVVFNGAEPIRAATLRTFSELFAPCGFRPSSFYPCYGLAESTLMVSGGQRHGGYRTHDVDAQELEAGRALPVRDRARTLVGVGRPMSGHTVTIVDDGGVPVPPGIVGEILIAGPSVARGYWGDPELSEATFCARIEGAPAAPGDREGRGFAGGPEDRGHPDPHVYLRSGDLGFVNEEGELFVTGRRKDLIILRGRNLFPQDIEEIVEAAHPAVRRGCSAAFAASAGAIGSIDSIAAAGSNDDDEERLIVAAEVERHTDFAAVARAIHRAIADEFTVRAAEVLLLKEATIPKTSSGKLRRFQCRKGHRDNTLDVIYRG
ncbi:fatty acyl-AMP ligase [Pendulispora albinea]|uniref:Fatty acyl-AMP ligase n=1 Tax=Pendulispora albinea TaxID=2741071 RepID=A0ABZ2MAH2_9BACT